VQGGGRRAECLDALGARDTFGPTWNEVCDNGVLQGIEVDLNALSEPAMTLAALAPFANRPTRIGNVAHLRLQASDRLRAMATEVSRLGVRVDEEADSLTIYPSRVAPAVVETYDDHRIAMSLALIGLRVPGIGIRNPACVRKTFPNFFDKLEELYR